MTTNDELNLPTVTEEARASGFWAVVEMMGHAQIAGFCTEYLLADTKFLRVDVPEVDDVPAFSRLLGKTAIYAVNPCSEAIAKRAATETRAEPLMLYHIRQEADRTHEVLALVDREAEHRDEYVYDEYVYDEDLDDDELDPEHEEAVFHAAAEGAHAVEPTESVPDEFFEPVVEEDAEPEPETPMAVPTTRSALERSLVDPEKAKYRGAPCNGTHEGSPCADPACWMRDNGDAEFQSEPDVPEVDPQI